MMNSCTGIPYKRLHVQIRLDNGSSDPLVLFDDGIDASGGEVVLCDARTGTSSGSSHARERERTRFLMRSYTLLS